MPNTMYNKKSGKNVKVYGFVSIKQDMYAITYQSIGMMDQNVEDLKLAIVPAKDLRPLEI